MKSLLPMLLLAVQAGAAEKSPYRLIRTEGSLTAGGAPVAVGSFLPFGVAVSLAQGTAVVDAGNGVYVRFKAPAEFIPRKKKPKAAIFLRQGSALVVRRKADTSFALMTPAIAAAPTSTAFYVEARGPGETYLCACDNSSVGPRETDRSHRGMLFHKHQFKVGSVKGLQNHSDDDLVSLRLIQQKAEQSKKRRKRDAVRDKSPHP